MKILSRAGLAVALAAGLASPALSAVAATPATNAAPPALPVPVLPAETNTPVIPALPAATNAAPARTNTAGTTAAARKKAAAPKTAAKTPSKAAPKETKPKKADAKAAQAKPEPLLSPEPGVAKQNNVNVRGQATIGSEVVAHLKKGEQITILEEVSKPAKQDDPGHWYKIALSTNVSVWVHSSFVDTNAGTVKARKLNLRGGPGENYSVVGRLEKGASIKAISAKGEWIKIEPPTNSFAFVAAHLIDRTPGAAIAAAKPAPAPAAAKSPEIAAATPPPPAPAPVVPVPAPVVPPPTVTDITPAPATAAPAPITPAAPVETAAATPAPAPARPAPVPAPAETIPAPTETTNAAPIETVRKTVSREGILKGSVSIQAPTYFELRSLDTGKAIDYVFSPSTNLVLKEFKGQRVIVTGEEVLDERWQHTPVLVVETLQSVP